ACASGAADEPIRSVDACSLPGPPYRVGPPRPQPGASVAGRGGAQRSDLDLQVGTVRVRAAFTQRRSYSSAIILGPPKSNASAAEARPAPLDMIGTLPVTSTSGGAGIKDLMARMGHDSERAALIYQHEARGADQAITAAIDRHAQAEQRGDEDDDSTAGVLAPVG